MNLDLGTFAQYAVYTDSNWWACIYTNNCYHKTIIYTAPHAVAVLESLSEYLTWGLSIIIAFTCSTKQLAVSSTESLLSSNRQRNILYARQKTKGSKNFAYKPIILCSYSILRLPPSIQSNTRTWFIKKLYILLQWLISLRISQLYIQQTDYIVYGMSQFWMLCMQQV